MLLVLSHLNKHIFEWLKRFKISLLPTTHFEKITPFEKLFQSELNLGGNHHTLKKNSKWVKFSTKFTHFKKIFSRHLNYLEKNIKISQSLDLISNWLILWWFDNKSESNLSSLRKGIKVDINQIYRTMTCISFKVA